MSETLRAGILGAGFAGLSMARGMAAAGGYKVDAVCDLAGARVTAFSREFAGVRVVDHAETLARDPELDVIAVCLPTDLHGIWALKALRAKKHVLLETPATRAASEMRALIRAAEKSTKILLPIMARRHGVHEAAARQAVEKGYVGIPAQVRATWLRAAGIPQGTRNIGELTGWYLNHARSGGGALLDLGLPMLDLAWSLLGEPKPTAVFAVAAKQEKLAVEEGGTVLVRFEGGKTAELCVAWAVRSAPGTYGMTCRVSGDVGAIDVYTRDGATLYRGEPEKPKAVLLKGPKISHHTAVARQLRAMVKEGGDTLAEARRALTLLRVAEAMYRSVDTGRSVEIREA